MDLYVFGYNGHGQLDDSKANILVPTKILSAPEITIPWTSWSDGIVITTDIIRNAPSQKLIYTGIGLTKPQLNHITTQCTQSTHPYSFFTSGFGDSLRGMIDFNPTNKTVMFLAKDHELQPPGIQLPHTHTVPFSPLVNILHVSTTGGGNTSVASKSLDIRTYDEKFISHYATFEEFKTSTIGPPQAPDANNTIPSCVQLVSNATTTTALTRDGKVYTWAADQRYPICLGRHSAPEALAEDPHPIPYLSETKVVKIAAGGYMTAAISDDGELYMWGRACPGIEGELEALIEKRYAMSDGEGEEEDDGVEKVVYSDEDEFVKCVPISIDGEDARVTDVAIGSGHILIAAEGEVNGVLTRAILAAGQGEYGQLGLGGNPKFVEHFRKIPGLDGRTVKCLVAAGWSSWVVLGSLED